MCVCVCVQAAVHLLRRTALGHADCVGHALLAQGVPAHDHPQRPEGEGHCAAALAGAPLPAVRLREREAFLVSGVREVREASRVCSVWEECARRPVCAVFGRSARGVLCVQCLGGVREASCVSGVWEVPQALALVPK